MKNIDTTLFVMGGVDKPSLNHGQLTSPFKGV